MRIKIWFFLLLAFGVLPLSAQTKHEVEGEIFDERGEPIPFATIGFYSLLDSSLVNGGVADEVGVFSIQIGTGNYYLEYSFLGYIKQVLGPIKVEGVLNIGRVILKGDITQIEELVVEAKRFDIEVRPGVKKYNIGETPGLESSSALDVLQNLPSTNLDSDEQLTFQGRKVSILIDGVETDVADMLDQLPASEIEAIEIMSNPSAKYDTKNGTSIINIVSKKSKKTSRRAKIAISRGTDQYAKGNLVFNWSKDKLNIGASANFKRNNVIDESTNLRARFKDDTTFTDQRFDGIREDVSGNYQLKIGYRLNNNSQLRWTGAAGHGTNKLNRDYIVVNSNGEEPTRYTERERNGVDNRKWYRSDILYKKIFNDTKNELSIRAKLSFNERVNNFDFADSLFNPDRSFKSSNEDRINDHLAFEYQPEFNIDYTHNLRSESSLDMGLIGRFRNVKRTYEYSELVNEIWTTDLDRSNIYKYAESSYAGYIVLNAQMPRSSSFTYQLGGRVSYIRLNPRAIGVSGDFSSELVNFLPSLQLAYEISESHNLSWSFTRRVRTPRYNQMNPFVTFYNPTSIGYGNPFLKNEKITTIEFGQTKSMNDEKLFLTQSIYYKHIGDAAIRYRFEDEDEILNVTYDNVDAAGQFGVETAINLKIAKRWKWNTNLNVFNSVYTTFDSDRSLIRRRGTNYNFKSTLSYQTQKGFSSRLQSSYFSETLTAQGYNEEYYFLDYILSQKLAKKKLSLTFKITDIFSTRKRNSLVDQLSSVRSETRYTQNYHRYYFTASYQLKKLKVIEPK